MHACFTPMSIRFGQLTPHTRIYLEGRYLLERAAVLHTFAEQQHIGIELPTHANAKICHELRVKSSDVFDALQCETAKA